MEQIATSLIHAAYYKLDDKFIWADFNENLNGGSSDIVLNQISAVVIKRKESASSKNLWTTIYRKKINSEI